MIKTNKKNGYVAFGLNILSDFVFLELTPLTVPLENPDIVIEINNLTSQWNEVADPFSSFYIRENLVLFKINETAIFSVQDGNKIIVSPLNGSEEDKIRLYILGTCMGALLLQRKVLPLHGSAIAINGKAYAIVGEREAGKSTLASSLINKGYSLLSDDIIPVTFNGDNRPIVIPSYPQQKLWQESLSEFGMDASQFKSLFERETKYAVPATEHFYPSPLELAGVFELIKSETENIKLRKVQGLERFHLLYKHTFRNFFLPDLSLREWHFKYISGFVNKVCIHQLIRPSSEFTANKLANLIINTI